MRKNRNYVKNALFMISSKEKEMSDLMENILTVDVGNSDIVFIIYNENKDIVYKKRIPTEKNPEFYKENTFKFIKEEFKENINLTVTSIVVPTIRENLKTSLREISNGEIVDVVPLYSGFDVGYEESKELGADFIASGWGALYSYKKPSIIIDMGTASKISVVDFPNKFLGGIIQPGIGQLVEIIHNNIPHLPKVQIKKPKTVIGFTTIEFIQSGIIYGAFESLLGLSERMKIELKKDAQIIFTGGYSNLYKDEKGDFVFDFDLVNKGLYVYGKNFQQGLIEKAK